jgi:hypothetical protein
VSSQLKWCKIAKQILRLRRLGGGRSVDVGLGGYVLVLPLALSSVLTIAPLHRCSNARPAARDSSGIARRERDDLEVIAAAEARRLNEPSRKNAVQNRGLRAWTHCPLRSTRRPLRRPDESSDLASWNVVLSFIDDVFSFIDAGSCICGWMLWLNEWNCGWRVEEVVAIVVGWLLVGRPLFVVANVMCGGWLWLSDGVPD